MDGGRLAVYAALLLGAAFLAARTLHRSYGLGRFGLTPATTLMLLVGALGIALVAAHGASVAGRRRSHEATVLVELRPDGGASTAAVEDARAMLRAGSAALRTREEEGGLLVLLLDFKGATAAADAEATVEEGSRLLQEAVVLPRASRAAGRAVYGRYERVERVERGSDGRPVDGGWTPFSRWGACVPHQGLCGQGTQTRRRECAMPRPQNGGAACSGEAEELRACAVACPGGGA